MQDTTFAPGEYLKDELESRGWTQEAFSHILGRPLKTVNQILMGSKAITPQTAQEIAAALGTSAELWMNLETAYRLGRDNAERKEVARRAKLYETAPVRDMIRRRWIADMSDPSELESAIKEFCSVPIKAAARMSAPYNKFTSEQKAWFCRVLNIAKSVPAARFRPDTARQYLDELHALTVSEYEVRHIPRVLSDMGIRFILLEHLPRTRIDGAAIWLDGHKPVIAVTLRHDRIDGFWHTLCHELSHVLHEDNWSVDSDLIGINKMGTEDMAEHEKRADAEASNLLIPKEKLDSFIRRHQPRFSKANIVRFANLHQIHPGIVIGQLQHRRAIKYSHSREMLVPVREILADSALTDGWGHFV